MAKIEVAGGKSVTDRQLLNLAQEIGYQVGINNHILISGAVNSGITLAAEKGMMKAGRAGSIRRIAWGEDTTSHQRNHPNTPFCDIGISTIYEPNRGVRVARLCQEAEDGLVVIEPGLGSFVAVVLALYAKHPVYIYAGGLATKSVSRLLDNVFSTLELTNEHKKLIYSFTITEQLIEMMKLP